MKLIEAEHLLAQIKDATKFLKYNPSDPIYKITNGGNTGYQVTIYRSLFTRAFIDLILSVVKNNEALTYYFTYDGMVDHYWPVLVIYTEITRK